MTYLYVKLLVCILQKNSRLTIKWLNAYQLFSNQYLIIFALKYNNWNWSSFILKKKKKKKTHQRSFQYTKNIYDFIVGSFVKRSFGFLKSIYVFSLNIDSQRANFAKSLEECSVQTWKYMYSLETWRIKGNPFDNLLYTRCMTGWMFGEKIERHYLFFLSDSTRPVLWCINRNLTPKVDTSSANPDNGENTIGCYTFSPGN